MADEATDTYDESLDLIEVGGTQTYRDVITSLETGVGGPLYPGDERRIFGEALVAVLVAYVSKANDASKQVMLRFARGQVLDAIGERLGVTRIPATPATCQLRFTLSAARDRAITIPAMTRVTPDGTLYFRTDEPLAIPAGQLEGTVTASCTTAGEAGNGIEPGVISTLVDLQPYVESVRNIDETHGGDDGEPYTIEGDDRLRERIRLAPNKLSTAGPEQAYRYWAMSADADIADVAVISEEFDDERTEPVRAGHVYVGGDLLMPEVLLEVEGGTTGFTYTYADSLLDVTLAGELASRESVALRVHRRMDGRVRIVPLMEGGRMPDADVLEAVKDACNARDVRPMTDVVTVSEPVPVSYDIALEYWTEVDDEATVVQAVEGPDGAIDRYVADQSAVLGRHINPDMLKAYVMDAGALRCDVTSPAHVEVGPAEVAFHSGKLTVSHKVEARARWS